MGIIWMLLFINITNKCSRVNIVSFILLTTIGMKCHSELYEMKWTKIPEYDNLVPKLANFLISEFEMIGRVECVLRCSMDKPACLEVFYNGLQGSCKLLRSNLNQTLVYDIQTGWECLAENGETASWDFGWLCSSEHCYLLNQTQQSWIDAKQQCRHLGAHLAEIDSPEENTWIKENVLTEIPGDIDPNFWTQCT
ncbi:uncharacterized protein LOC125661176 [Ostrea edulis]|uniref:uncharacterized protein LOC125661176 n=1 Tax=Ostrea edulis TaxID=37623 RepID=UPI0024AF884E|nr:uncharacterized protein LOC125661176 [Ostrea edulis]